MLYITEYSVRVNSYSPSVNAMRLAAGRLNPEHLHLARLLVGEVGGVIQLGLRGDEDKLLLLKFKWINLYFFMFITVEVEAY